jgi:hypothetical protein
MRSNTNVLNVAATPGPQPVSLLARARDAVRSLLQRLDQARTERARRAAVAQLDPATLRDLGLDTSTFGGDSYWSASRWTARHNFERYL